jgi:hypothetical protein
MIFSRNGIDPGHHLRVPISYVSLQMHQSHLSSMNRMYECDYSSHVIFPRITASYTAVPSHCVSLTESLPRLGEPDAGPVPNVGNARRTSLQAQKLTGGTYTISDRDLVTARL